MAHHTPSMTPEEAKKISSVQDQLARYWTDTGPDVQKFVDAIGTIMLSARLECLLILDMFAGNTQQLEAFLKAAEPMRALKPATVPTLLRSIGKLDEKLFAESNVVDVLNTAA